MSTFVLNRGYALQLPTSYVEVEREEMEYVEGGIACSTLGWILDGCITVALAAYGIYGGIKTIGALLGRNCKGLVVAAFSTALKWAKVSLATSIITGLYSILTYFTSYSIGRGIAYGLDRIDKVKGDGNVAFW